LRLARNRSSKVYVTLGLEADALRVVSRQSTYVGCIVEWDGRILLTQTATQSSELPSAPIEGNCRNHQERIDQLLSRLRIKGEASFPLFGI
jgi:hypothetical protein